MSKSEKNKSMLLISNLYPSEKYPFYGTFVKHFNDISENYFDVDKIVLFKVNSKLKKLINYFLFYGKIIFNILFKKYDVIYVHYISHVSIPLLLCKKLKKFNLYTNVHGSDIIPVSNLGKRLLKYTASILNKSQCVIVPSSYFKELVKEEFGIDEKEIRVYASGGIKEEVFYKRNDTSKNDILKKFNLEEDKKYIGFASRIIKGKGWEIFIEAINLMKINNDEVGDKYKFIIIGNGKEYKKMIKMIEEYGLEDYIVLFNLLSQEELAEMYSIMDWFVFPTYCKESLGLVGIEAMACGTPVIASNMAGPTTYVKDNINGFLFKPKDVKALYNAILKSINMSDSVYEKMQKQCLETASDYTSEAIIDSYEKIFS